MKDMEKIPDWLQELWVINPSIARRAEKDLDEYKKVIGSAYEYLSQTSLDDSEWWGKDEMEKILKKE